MQKASYFISFNSSHSINAKLLLISWLKFKCRTALSSSLFSCSLSPFYLAAFLFACAAVTFEKVTITSALKRAHAAKFGA